MRTPLYKSRPYGPHSARFEGERINDFIVMSEGCSNSYLIETPEGSILINTGMGYEAPVHLKNYQGLSTDSDNIRYVITTQGHVDHVGGVQFFRDRNPGMTYIAQANNEEHQTYDERLWDFRSSRSAFRFLDTFTKDFAYYAEQGYTDINTQDRPRADLTFEDRYEFTLGGLEVVLIGIEGAETNDSLVVWLPQHRICLTGNLFGCPFGHFPNLVTIRGDRYRDALTCAAAAQTAQAPNAKARPAAEDESAGRAAFTAASDSATTASAAAQRTPSRRAQTTAKPPSNTGATQPACWPAPGLAITAL